MNNYIFINTFLCIYFYLKQWKFFFINLNQKQKEKKEQSLKENNESKEVSDLIYLIHLECNFLEKEQLLLFLKKYIS